MKEPSPIRNKRQRPRATDSPGAANIAKAARTINRPSRIIGHGPGSKNNRLAVREINSRRLARVALAEGNNPSVSNFKKTDGHSEQDRSPPAFEEGLGGACRNWSTLIPSLQDSRRDATRFFFSRPRFDPATSESRGGFVVRRQSRGSRIMVHPAEARAPAG